MPGDSEDARVIRSARRSWRWNEMRRSATAAFLVLAITGCQREKREPRPQPGQVVVYSSAARQSELQPGGPKSAPDVQNPSYGNALAISEGQRLFSWYNCSGCHANGGGGMGPPLIKQN